MSDITLDTHTQAQRSEFRRGWSVILACFCTATFAWGFGFYGQSVYFATLHTTRGWPASLIASATTTYYLTGALLLTQVHRAIAALGPRIMVLAGAVILGVGAIGMSRVTAPWQLYLCGVVMAVGWAATTTTAIALTLAHWFDRKRGLALSLALNGASAGGFTIAPLLVHLVYRMGLGHAVPLLVLASLAVVLPIVVLGVGRTGPVSLASPRHVAPERRQEQTAFASPREALGSLHFWTVALPFALALAAQVGFIVHEVAFLLPHLGSDGTGIAVAATAVAAMVGRLGCAPVIDRLNQRRVSAASFASQAAGLALMLALPDQPAALYLGCAVFGLSVGNVITLPALIIQREFTPHCFGLVIGLSSMVGQATLAFGPTLLGIARDASGSYGAALCLCIALQITGALLVLSRRGQA